MAMIADGIICSGGKPSDVLNEQMLGDIYQMDVRVADIRLDGDEVLRQIVPVRTKRTKP